jgi:hypothetical protein
LEKKKAADKKEKAAEEIDDENLAKVILVWEQVYFSLPHMLRHQAL